MENISNSTLERQIQEALGAHGAMKQRLRAAVQNGNLPRPAFMISTDHGCKFGKWLFHLKSDDSIARSPHYKAVVTAHAGFHKAAGRIARLVEDGQSDRAAEMLNALGYRQAASKLMTELMAWRRNI